VNWGSRRKKISPVGASCKESRASFSIEMICIGESFVYIATGKKRSSDDLDEK